jgi:multidrug efflux pump
VALAAYLLLTQVLSILLMPMFMYASATLTLVSEKMESDCGAIQSIPQIAMKCAAAFYVSLAIIAFIFRDWIFSLINPDLKVVALTSALFFVFLIANIMRISSTIFSYSLQALGFSHFVLYRSATVNAISLAVVLLGASLAKGDAYFFLMVCAFGMLFNYGAITLVGRNRYHREAESMRTKSGQEKERK